MKTGILFWRKMGFILFGISVTLLFLEIGLRLGGAVLLQMQEHKNRIALKTKGAYRIMCIGESTTQDQYPPFLEEALDKTNFGIRFSVIDKGIGATTTSIIVSQLEENIEKYSPDMVVAMIGINDDGVHMPVGFNRSSRFSIASLKIYKLAQLLLTHIQNKIERIKGNRPRQNSVGAGCVISDGEPAKTGTNVEDESDIYTELGKQLIAQGQEESARRAFLRAVQFNPYNIDAILELFWLTEDPVEQKEIFEGVFQRHKKLIEVDGMNDVPSLRYFCAVFVDCPEGQMYLKELEELLEKILARDPGNNDATLNLAYMFLKQHRYGEAEQLLKRYGGAREDDDSLRLFDYFAILYHDTGKFALSEYYLREAHKIRPQHYSELTINNYKKIKVILEARKIKLVCVQYPLRSVENLQKIFYGEKNILFVDNESVFKNALKQMSYEDLFSDLFAGDFGHCTEKGNRLLAENIANVILQEVFKVVPVLSW